MQQLETSFSIEELQKADLKKLQIYYLGLRLGYELKRRAWCKIAAVSLSRRYFLYGAKKI